VDAQQELGFCYANGKGCKKDLKEAAKWYRAAVRSWSSICARFPPHRRTFSGRTRRLDCRSGMDLQAKVRRGQRLPKGEREGEGSIQKPAQPPLAHPHTGSSIYSGTQPGSIREGPRKLRKPNPKLKSNPSSPRPSGVEDVLEVRNLNRVLEQEEWDREREVAW
jgi:hypothetical protein